MSIFGSAVIENV